MRAVEHAGVGDQHQRQRVELMLPFHIGTGRDDLVEVPVRRRFAVAGERDVGQPPQCERRVAELARLEQSLRRHQFERALEVRPAVGGVSTNRVSLWDTRLTWQ